MRVCACLLLLALGCAETKAPSASADPAKIAALEELLGGRYQLLRIGLAGKGVPLVVTATSALRPDLIRYDVLINAAPRDLLALARMLDASDLPSQLLGVSSGPASLRLEFSTFVSPRRPTQPLAEREKVLRGLLELADASLPWTQVLRISAEQDCFQALHPEGKKTLRLDAPPNCRPALEQALKSAPNLIATLSPSESGLRLEYPDHAETMRSTPR
ncbi:MAG: hypothetical protein U1E65_33950 [Myxococcota bacterium]